MKKKIQLWIYRRSKILEVLLLKTRPERGETWQPVTGWVEEGEALVLAAVREGEEETGLSFSEDPFFLGMEFDFEGRHGKARESVFAREAMGSSEVVLDPGEHTEFEWVSFAEGIKRVPFDSQKNALKRLMKALL